MFSFLTVRFRSDRPSGPSPGNQPRVPGRGSTAPRNGYTEPLWRERPEPCVRARLTGAAAGDLRCGGVHGMAPVCRRCAGLGGPLKRSRGVGEGLRGKAAPGVDQAGPQPTRSAGWDAERRVRRLAPQPDPVRDRCGSCRRQPGGWCPFAPALTVAVQFRSCADWLLRRVRFGTMLEPPSPGAVRRSRRRWASCRQRRCFLNAFRVLDLGAASRPDPDPPPPAALRLVPLAHSTAPRRRADARSAQPKLGRPMLATARAGARR